MTEEPRRNIATAPIFIDGVRVGTITCGDARDVSPDPLGNNFAFGPAPSPSAFPRLASREYPGRDFGAGHRPTHHAPRHLAPHGGEHHHRYLSPELRKHPRSAEEIRHREITKHPDFGDDSKSRRTPEEIGKHPDFGGMPKEESTFAKIAPSGRGIDRKWQHEELESNPALKESLFRHSLGENIDPIANQAVMEEAANRADIRRQLRGSGGMGSHGNLSYFQGYYRGDLGPYKKMLEENYRKVFEEGSDVSQGAIDNSSGSLAQHEVYGGGKFPRPGAFTNTFNAGGRNGDNRVGAPGVESFHAPGYSESGTGEREFYPEWRKQQLRSARNPAESTLGAERPVGPAAPNHSVDSIEKARQLNRDAVDRARHFNNEPLSKISFANPQMADDDEATEQDRALNDISNLSSKGSERNLAQHFKEYGGGKHKLYQWPQKGDPSNKPGMINPEPQQNRVQQLCHPERRLP
jgi:hypothetical protein